MFVMRMLGERCSCTKAAKSDAQVESTKNDQHKRDAEFQAQPEALRDDESEHNDSAADYKECDAVPNSPKHSYDRRVSNVALAAHDCRYSDHVIGICGMPHSEEESECKNRKECGHTLGAVCVSRRRTDLMAHSWPCSATTALPQCGHRIVITGAMASASSQ